MFTVYFYLIINESVRHNDLLECQFVVEIL
jgi:hypothetical protein